MLRNAELEAMVKQNSGNTSKPPSSDLGRKRKPPVEPSGRKRGGQPGHVGQTRELAPPEEVDDVVDQDPQTCENGGESLEQEPRLDAFLRQVTETPWYKALSPTPTWRDLDLPLEPRCDWGNLNAYNYSNGFLKPIPRSSRGTGRGTDAAKPPPGHPAILTC